MKESLLRQAAKLKQKNHDHKRWQKAVSILACVVVFCTVYALILPAVTMEKTAYCGKEEHTHTEDCYEKQLICGKEEGEGAHQHSDDCYQEEQVLVCPLEESEGHQHTDACYTEEHVLTCTNTDPDHEHNEFEGCYTTERVLTCGQETGEGAHHHTAECYETQKVLVCGQEENDGHHHTEDCYKKELICQKEEHTHTLECYSNPEADVETEAQWSRTFANVTLTGDWAKDLTAIAETQTGYTESDRNYTVNADNTTNGYTRYGQWAGMPYADWSATFTSFCLYYANVPESAVPRNTGCEGWNGSAVSPNGYTPKEGDLILLDGNQDGTTEHAGIVTSGSADSVTAIVGDSDKAVRRNTYSTSNAIITGYVPMPQNPALADNEPEETPTPEITEEPEATPIPEITEEPESTVTPMPEISEVAKPTETPEITPTPEVTEIPEPTKKATSDSEKQNENKEMQDVADTQGTTWCIVEQDNMTEDQNEFEEELSDDENITETYSLEAMAARSANSVALDDYITGISISKLSNGSWTKLTGDSWTLSNGDKIIVDMNYAVNGGLPVGKDSLSYQLPSQIHLSEEVSGPVTQNGVTVGTFTISKNGEVIIQLDNTKFKPNETFNGTFQFEGTVDRLGDGNDEKIIFPGVDKDIIIKKDELTYDLTIKKDGKLNDDNKSLDYTITVESNTGTGDNKVTIKDYFNSSDSETNYDENSFTIVKVDAQGKETPVSQKPTFGTDNGNKAFEYKDLPALGKGEKYIVRYKAETTPTNKAGGGKVSNSAGAITPDKNTWDRKDIVIPGVMIKKSGNYDQDNNQITWTIVVNQDKTVELDGHKLTDILPEGIDPVSISISPALPGGQTIIDDLSDFVFPSGSGNEEYTITYITTVPAGNKGEKITNTVSMDDGKWSDGADVWPHPREDSVSKSWNSEGLDNNENPIYNWFTDLAISADGVDEVQYKDTILPAQDENGVFQDSNSHYAVSKELYQSLIKDFSLKISTSSTIDYSTAIQNGYEVDFHFYSDTDGSNEITDIQNSDSHVTYFTVTVKKNDGSRINACSLTLRYYTHVDYSNMSTLEKWTFKNKGIYGNHESEGSHTYEKPPKFVKQTGIKESSGNIKYQNGDRRIDYKVADGYLYYRLMIRPDKDEEIEITDELSDSGMSFDVESVKARFYFDESNVRNVCYDSGNHIYNFDGNEKPEISITTSENNTQILKVKIKPGYICHSQNHEALVVIYRVKISDDLAWKDLNVTGKTYENTAHWGDISSSAKTIVENREIEKVKKAGTQRIETTTEGKTTYKDIIDYSVVINPAGNDLIPDSDTIKLVDNLTCPNGVKAYLDLQSIKLYEYDATASDYRGVELDRAKYKVQYDDSDSNKPKLTVSVPDAKPCVLIYTYVFDRGTNIGTNINGTDKTELKISNKANLEGEYDSNSEISLINQKGSATVNQANITIYKVDKNDYSVRLANAKFKLDAYENGSWEEAVVTLNNSTGNGTYDSESQTYITGSGGYLKFDTETNTKNPDARLLQPNTVYRLTEVEAPFGYKQNNEPYYFVMLQEKDENTFKYSEPLSGKKNVYFFDNGKEVSMTVDNEFVGVSVRKVWEDENGNVMSGGGSDVQVQLYRSRHVQGQNAREITIEYYADNKLKDSQKIYIKKGTPLFIQWNCGINASELSERFPMLPEGCKIQIKDNADYGSPIIEIPADRLQDTIKIGSQDWCYTTNRDLSYVTDMVWGTEEIAKREVIDPETGQKTEVDIPPVTLSTNSTTPWSYTWTNLPTISDSGEKWYYTVKEISAPSGYTVSYTNNDGVEVGGSEMVVTNRKEEGQYELPETGGIGTNRFTAVGLSLMAASLMCEYVMRRKRRERRGN